MSEKTVRVALDAMGGDNAPDALIDGALLALTRSDEISIMLVGREDDIRRSLSGKEYDDSRITIVNATEVIEMAEHPVNAIRRKKDSSIVVGLNLVKDGQADIFVSAGSTGAILVGGQLITGRIKGVDRAPIAAVYPTTSGGAVLIDSGANMDPRVKNIRQYAVMGSIYAREVMGIQNPTVGLLNIGAEEEKGNAFYIEAHKALKETPGINFTGNIEARDFPMGKVDVVVCDAFTGNIVLKTLEGTAKALLGMVKQGLMSSLRSKIGGLLIKPALKGTLKKMDSSEYGGAPLLGLKGLVVKTHGSATAKEVCNTLLQCPSFVNNNIVEKITASLAELEENEPQE